MSEQDSLSCSFFITKEQRLDCLLFLYRKKFFDTFCEFLFFEAREKQVRPAAPRKSLGFT